MGAGGDGSKVLLASCGANTIRSWGVDDDLQQTLDEAQALNLAVIVGIGWVMNGMALIITIRRCYRNKRIG
jgi:hypothetical protein